MAAGYPPKRFDGPSIYTYCRVAGAARGLAGRELVVVELTRTAKGAAATDLGVTAAPEVRTWPVESLPARRQLFRRRLGPEKLEAEWPHFSVSTTFLQVWSGLNSLIREAVRSVLG
ncbi:MAG: hypothetical protein WB497_01205, partial [Pseudolabrys sp.]